MFQGKQGPKWEQVCILVLEEFKDSHVTEAFWQKWEVMIPKGVGESDHSGLCKGREIESYCIHSMKL